MRTSRGSSVPLLLTVLFLAAGSPAGAQEAADRAWTEGDLTTAERLYAVRLEADPRDQRALHRLALMRAWDGRSGESLALFERLLSLAPGNVDAARDRARVLAWDGNLEAAVAAYEAILADHPEDTEARLGLAQVHLWDARYDEADRLFGQVLAGNPRDPTALEGRAQVAAWSGRLATAETRWRAALDAIPDHPPFLVGLARTLLWQGRPAAALEVLQAARRAHPDEEAVARELTEMSVQFEPFVAARMALERDSDGNRLLETSARGEWHPASRLATRIELTSRRAEDLGTEASSTQLSAGMALTLEPGWEARAAAGLDVDDGGDAEPILRLGLSTPGRYATRVSLNGSYAPLPGTARSIERDVTSAELGIDLATRIASGWRLSGGASATRIEGSRSNRRTAGRVGLVRRLAGGWSVDGSVRALGFESDLDDGYFDPSHLVLAEVGPGWAREGKGWSLEAAAAGGVQQVAEEDSAPTFRADATATFRLGSGEILIEGAFATAALTAFSTGEADYRFGRLGLGTRWRF